MWLIYALLGAVGKSYSGFFRKKMAGNISAAMFVWVSNFIILIIMTPFMISRLSSVVDAFIKLPLVVLGASLSLLVATKMNLEALKREELSYTAPLNAFMPVFTLIIASVFLNENPPKFGILGIFAIFIGAYVVNISSGRLHWYDPLLRLARSAGALFSLGVAFGYAVNTVLMKVISNNGYDSLTILYLVTLLGWLFFIHIPFTKRGELISTIKSDKIVLIGAAVSSFAGSFFHILAITSTYTSYASAVRRIESLFAIGLGWRYLKESDIRNKLIGGTIMTIGAVIMAIS